MLRCRGLLARCVTSKWDPDRAPAPLSGMTMLRTIGTIRLSSWRTRLRENSSRPVIERVVGTFFELTSASTGGTTMAGQHKRGIARDQTALLPPTIEDYVAGDSVAR